MGFADGQGAEIYVVDDDLAIRKTLTAIFSAKGYEVICFADARRYLQPQEPKPQPVSFSTSTFPGDRASIF